MSVLGIDFGTDKCVVAVVRGGEVKIVVNDVSMRKTSSMVGYTDERRFIGESAVGQQAGNAANTVSGMKRLLGRKFSCEDVKSEVGKQLYKIVPGDKDKAMIEVSYLGEKKVLSPESVTAALLGQLKIFSEEFTGGPCPDAVISVPSYFTAERRQAVIDAAAAAGINVLSLMNETTAVALQYGLLRKLPKDKPIKVLFYDLGHSQLNVSLVSLTDTKAEVLASASDPNLGGRDFDGVILDIMLQQIAKKYKLDPRTNKKAFTRLSRESEKAKKVLSANSDTVYSLDCLMDDKDVAGAIERKEFEAASAPLLERLTKPVEEILNKLKLSLTDLDSVEVVGGCIRIPSVMTKLESYFSAALIKKTCDGDESVARGCALKAAMLSPKYRVMDFEIVDCVYHPIAMSLGVVGGADLSSDPLFSEFGKYPITKAINVSREESLRIALNYIETPKLPEDTSRLLSKFVIAGKKQDPAAEKKPSVKISVRMDDSGFITVQNAVAVETLVVPDAPAADAAAAPAAAPAPAPAAPEAAVGSEEAVNMDVDGEGATAAPPAEAKAAEPSAEKVSKKKLRTELTVSAEVNYGLNAKAKQEAFEIEATMAGQDRLVAETLARKNDLEAYIYAIRDRVEFGDLSEFVDPTEKEAYLAKLSETEEWLYGDGSFAQKSQYVTILNELKAVGEAADFRFKETTARPNAVGELKKAVFKFQKAARDEEKLYSHIENLADVTKLADDADQWLFEALKKIEKLPKTATPSVSSADILKKAADLEKEATRILSKPKPKPAEPAPAPAPGAADPAAASPAKDAEGAARSEGTTKMDVDSEGSKPAGESRMEVDS